MREAKFNTEIVNSLKEQGAWAEKIPDVPRGMGLRFLPEKPCDIIGGFKGTFFMIESKQMKKFEAFGARHFRDNQLDALDRAVQTLNPAYAFLNVRIASPRTNRLIILDWITWGHRLRQNSIKAEEIKKLPFIQGHKERFDLTKFLEHLCEK